MNDFKPKIIIFRCNWGACAGTDVADTLNNHNPRTIRTMCSGRIEPTLILHAFAQGVDGAMLLRNMLAQLGIEPERLKLEWISASEASKLHSVVNGFIDEVTERGPLTLDTRVPKETESVLRKLALPVITR